MREGAGLDELELLRVANPVPAGSLGRVLGFGIGRNLLDTVLAADPLGGQHLPRPIPALRLVGPVLAVTLMTGLALLAYTLTACACC